MAADSLTKSSGTPQDLGTLPDPSNPQPSLGVNMDTNNPQPSMGINADTMPSPDYTPTAADDASFQQAMAAARLGQGPTVGSTMPAAPAAAQPAAQPVSQPTRNVIAPGVSTAGTKPHTGGVAEMELQKEMLAMQLQKASIADRIAETNRTGRYAEKATPVTKQGVTMTGGDSVWDQSSGPSSGAKKPAKYVAGSGNVETDDSTDQPDQIKTDFEAFHPGVDLR